MKRLKHKLMSMPLDTMTYPEMYDGILTVFDPERPWDPPEKRGEPIYFADDIGYRITATHKLAQDKPTVTIMIPHDLLTEAVFPTDSLGIAQLPACAADHCLRRFLPYIDELNAALYNRSRPDNENGKYFIVRPNGEVTVRNAAYFALCPQRDYDYGSGSTAYLKPDTKLLEPKMCLCITIQVQLPKRKLRKTIQMLCRDLPDAVDRFVMNFDRAALAEAAALAETQAAIRRWLKDSEYCAFIANGSILPREKGSDLPLRSAVPFVSAPGDEIEVCGIRGMGIRRGVTVITGGGYSGKSTLLDAISAGIYDHIKGDGRELCITDDTAVSISAEDGRSVKHLNISPFIKWLPGGDTADFTTDHASGSTSQAANIMEAVSCGARLLCIDEDRSATNFMIRDRMMKELIEKEPITPFTDRARELYRTHGVSTVLVIGGSGEYLATADRVCLMEDYRICDVTDRAKAICAANGVTTDIQPEADFTQHRKLCADGFTSYPKGSGSERLEVSDMGYIIIGNEMIDVRGLHDIVNTRQLDAIGFILRMLMTENSDRIIDICAKIDELYERIGRYGIDMLYSSYFTTCGRFADLPRKSEVFAAVWRMRGIGVIK